MPADKPTARQRERSHKYPGAPLAEAVELARLVEDRGLDGLPAPAIAEAMGFSNIKSNAFSARLSAARQFGLLDRKGEGYHLTDLARAILHPVDPDGPAALHRRALLEPPLYAELAQRLGGKRLPEPAILANLLYHNHHITASAKQQAADAFLASAAFAGAIDPEGQFRPEGAPAADPGPPRKAPRRPADSANGHAPTPDHAPAGRPGGTVRIELPLRGRDAGRRIRLRAPESISRESFERFLQAFRLHVQIVEDGPPEGQATHGP